MEVALPAGTLRVESVGSGRPVVFVHGFLTNALLWRNVIPPRRRGGLPVPGTRLAARVAPARDGADADLSPWGLASVIASFLEELDLRDVVLVGNDTGGALAQMVVARHPERVGALVLTPCDAFRNWPAWWSKPLRPVGRSAVADVAARAAAAVPRGAAAAVRLRVGVQAPPAARGVAVVDRAGVGRRRRAARLRQGVQRCTASQTLEAAAALPSFRGRSMVVWSRERARIYPASHARRLAELLDARLEWVEDSYIYVPEDQPERLASLIVDFASDGH